MSYSHHTYWTTYTPHPTTPHPTYWTDYTYTCTTPAYSAHNHHHHQSPPTPTPTLYSCRYWYHHHLSTPHSQNVRHQHDKDSIRATEIESPRNRCGAILDEASELQRGGEGERAERRMKQVRGLMKGYEY